MARSVSGAKSARGSAPIPLRGRVLTPRQACEVFGVSYRTIKRMVAEGRIAFTRLPGSNRLRFFEADLVSALEQKRVAAEDDR
jgi:excisionase family DNA binding protein